MEVLITVLAAGYFFREHISARTLACGLASAVGVACIVFANMEVPSGSSLYGDFLIGIGTVFAVGYVLVSKSQIRSVDPLVLVTSQQFVGLLVVLATCTASSLFFGNEEFVLPSGSVTLWVTAALSGLIGYGLSFFLYLVALRRIAVGKAAFYVSLIPAFGVLSAVVLLGERISLIQVSGIVLVMYCSYAVNTGPQAVGSKRVQAYPSPKGRSLQVIKLATSP